MKAPKSFQPCKRHPKCCKSEATINAQQNVSKDAKKKYLSLLRSTNTSLLGSDALRHGSTVPSESPSVGISFRFHLCPKGCDPKSILKKVGCGSDLRGADPGHSSHTNHGPGNILDTVMGSWMISCSAI
ncbi:hypothetical protein TNCV_817761 [Trichonephila clavipes]|nr:hypothetical protein TNCV_817761 [Trichonephila clavipes]